MQRTAAATTNLLPITGTSFGKAVMIAEAVSATLQFTVLDRLVGLSSGTILLASALGTVKCQDHCAAGGLVGAGGGIIDQSYSKVTVTASGDQNSYAYAGGRAAALVVLCPTPMYSE